MEEGKVPCSLPPHPPTLLPPSAVPGLPSLRQRMKRHWRLQWPPASRKHPSITLSPIQEFLKEEGTVKAEAGEEYNKRVFQPPQTGALQGISILLPAA